MSRSSAAKGPSKRGGSDAAPSRSPGSEIATAKAPSSSAAAAKAARDAAQEARRLPGRLRAAANVALSCWLGAAGIAVLFGRSGSLRGIAGFAVLLAAVVGAASWHSYHRLRATGPVAEGAAPSAPIWNVRARRAEHKAAELDETLAPLRDLSPASAAPVRQALTLIEGPLHGLLDEADLTQTAEAIRRSLTNLAELAGTQARAKSALDELGDALAKAGQTPGDDAQWRDARDVVAELQARRDATATELSDGADRVIAGWEQIDRRQQRQAQVRALAAARSNVQKATGRAMQSEAADDGLASSRAQLVDAVDGLRARLGALDELADLTARVAPLSQELPAREQR
jgi:hypothetical protein